MDSYNGEQHVAMPSTNPTNGNNNNENQKEPTSHPHPQLATTVILFPANLKLPSFYIVLCAPLSLPSADKEQKNKTTKQKVVHMDKKTANNLIANLARVSSFSLVTVFFSCLLFLFAPWSLGLLQQNRSLHL